MLLWCAELNPEFMTITAPRDALLVYSFTVISSAGLRHSRIILSLHDSGCLWWQPESCRRIKVYGRDAFRCRKETFRLSPWGRSWTGWRYHPPSLCAFFSAATKHKIAVTFKVFKQQIRSSISYMNITTTTVQNVILLPMTRCNTYMGVSCLRLGLLGETTHGSVLSTHNESMLCYYLAEKYAFPHYLLQV